MKDTAYVMTIMEIRITLDELEGKKQEETTQKEVV